MRYSVVIYEDLKSAVRYINSGIQGRNIEFRGEVWARDRNLREIRMVF